MDTMQQEQAQNFFLYQQKVVNSTSITSLGGHTITLNGAAGLYGQNDYLPISLQNGEEIPTVAWTADTTLHSRSFSIGDKRALSSTKTIFTTVSFKSDQINMDGNIKGAFITNQLYYYNNKIKISQNQELAKGADLPNSFIQNLELDPLVYHNYDNLAYTNLTGTLQNPNLYRGVGTGNPVAAALPAIAAGAMITTICIPFYYLLPGIFELQDKIYLSNFTITLQVAQDYQIDAFVQNNSHSQAGVLTQNFTKTFFKFVPNQQIYIYSVQNTSIEMQYQIPFKYRIVENFFDLRSEAISIKMENVRFFSFMIIRKDLEKAAQLSTGRLRQDLFALNNSATQKIVINNISFNSGGKFVYATPNIATMRQPLQQKALENISGVRLNFPHLSFFTFEEITALDFNISINIFEQTDVGDYQIYYYIIKLEP